MVNNSTHGHSSDTSKQIDETDPLPPSLPLLHTHTHTHTLSLSLSSLALSLSPPLGKETKQRCVRTDWRFGCTEKIKKKQIKTIWRRRWRNEKTIQSLQNCILMFQFYLCCLQFKDSSVTIRAVNVSLKQLFFFSHMRQVKLSTGRHFGCCGDNLGPTCIDRILLGRCSTSVHVDSLWTISQQPNDRWVSMYIWFDRLDGITPR